MRNPYTSLFACVAFLATQTWAADSAANPVNRTR